MKEALDLLLNFELLFHVNQLSIVLLLWARARARARARAMGRYSTITLTMHDVSA